MEQKQLPTPASKPAPIPQPHTDILDTIAAVENIPKAPVINKNDENKVDDEKKIDNDWKTDIGSVKIKLQLQFDPNKGQQRLKKSGWFCDKNGKIVSFPDGINPTPNKCAYNSNIQEYIQFIFENEYKMKRIEIAEDANNYIRRADIFVSDQYEKKETLLMVIVGSGIVRAGVFACELCRLDNLSVGTAFAVLEWANKQDIGVVLCDPNGFSKYEGEIENRKNAKGNKVGNIREQIKNKKVKVNKKDGDKVNGDYCHSVYVFDNFVKPYLWRKDDKKIKKLFVLAHSLGGKRTTFLLRERGEIMRQYIGAIAFTDILDPCEQIIKYEKQGFKENAKIIRYIYRKCSVNWIKTKTGKKLDQLCKMVLKNKKRKICKALSSGHRNHKYTTASSLTSLIKFFEQK